MFNNCVRALFFNELGGSTMVKYFDLGENGCETGKFRVPCNSKYMAAAVHYNAPYISFQDIDSEKNGVTATFYDGADQFIIAESSCLTGCGFDLDTFHVPSKAEVMTISVKISPDDDDDTDSESDSSGYSDSEEKKDTEK